jgi:MoaA/NifB/PqqE/SkfB family radical SAM enzyme
VKRLVEITKKHDIEGSIVTNGTLITSEFAKHLVKNEWDGVAFSINGASSLTDNFLRGGKNAFERSLNGIENINYWKEKLGVNKPVLTLHPTITNYNYKEVVEMVEFAHKMKMGIVLFRLVNDRTGKFALDKNQSRELLSLMEKAKSVANKCGIEFIQEFTVKDLIPDFKSFKVEGKNISEQQDTYLHCSKPFFEIMISADGTTSPCCLICESRFKPDGPDSIMNYLDNIRNKKLKDVWYGRVFNLFRKSVINSAPEPCIKYCTTDQKYRINTGKLLDNRW